MIISEIIERVRSIINSCESLRQVDIARNYAELALKQISHEMNHYPRGLMIQFNVWVTEQYDVVLNKT